jgi:hypothetical protein
MANANQTGLPNDTIRRAIRAWFVARGRLADLPPNFVASGDADLGGAAAAAIRIIEQASGLEVDAGIAGPDVLGELQPFLPHDRSAAAATGSFGPRRVVIASVFEDPEGYHGDDLTRGPLGFAELSTNPLAPVAKLDFRALGGLPYRTHVRITAANGRQVVAQKLDIGAGGPHHPVIDLHARTAAALGLPADFLGNVTLEIAQG